MPSWRHRLDVSDAFGDEERPFPERRDLIVRRIRQADFWDEGDVVLVGIVDDLRASTSKEMFDDYWSDFYDWADTEGVWVDTF